MEPHHNDGELTRRSTIIYVVTLSTERAKKGNVYRCRVVSFQGTSFRGGTTQQRFDASFWCRFISGRGRPERGPRLAIVLSSLRSRSSAAPFRCRSKSVSMSFLYRSAAWGGKRRAGRNEQKFGPETFLDRSTRVPLGEACPKFRHSTNQKRKFVSFQRRLISERDGLRLMERSRNDHQC